MCLENQAWIKVPFDKKEVSGYNESEFDTPGRHWTIHTQTVIRKLPERMQITFSLFH